MLYLEEVSVHIWVAPFPTQEAHLGWEREMWHMSRIWVRGQEDCLPILQISELCSSDANAASTSDGVYLPTL